MTKTKPKPALTFPKFHRDRRTLLVERLMFCISQTEAARVLLERAESSQLKLDFWAAALEFAEDEESNAHKSLSRFDARDFAVDRQNFDFATALRTTANVELRKLKKRKRAK